MTVNDLTTRIEPEHAGMLLSIMDGNVYVMGILADWLDEHGKEFEAKYIRHRKRLTKDIKRLVCTFSLPSQLNDRLACDFAMHVLPIFEAAYPEERVPRLAIESRIAWLEGRMSREELENLLPLMRDTAYQHHLVSRDRGRGRLHIHIHCAAINSYGLQYTSPSHESQCKCSQSAGSYHADGVGKLIVEAMLSPQREAERDWQLTKLREVILTNAG